MFTSKITKRITSSFILLVIGSFLAAQPKYLSNEIVVKFDSELVLENKVADYFNSKTKISEMIKGFEPMFVNFNNAKLNIPRQYDLSSIYRVHVYESSDLLKLINQINSLDEVVYAEPYYLQEAFYKPNDVGVGKQYYLSLIEAFEAFDVTKGDTNIVIGIVDTGTDFLHPDLSGNYKFNYADPINGIDDDFDGFVDNFQGWDIAMNDEIPQFETNDHGVWVQGIAGATPNNEIGLAGVGLNSMVTAIKIQHKEGFLYRSYEGIVYAADHGCDIINCSWGGPVKSRLCDDVIEYVTNYKKCLVVAAAGNDHNEVPFYPASHNLVVSVAATDSNDEVWNGTTGGSTFGIEIDVCAPGVAMYSTHGNGGYGYTGGGTSFATPVVSGVAALVKSVRPDFLPKQIAEQIRITSDVIDTAFENQFYYHKIGYGRVNAYRAVSVNDLPALRIENIKVSSSVDNYLLSGDTLTVSFSTINYLAQVTNTLVKLTSNSDHITPISNYLFTGSMGTLDTLKNSNQIFSFLVKEQVPIDHEFTFTFFMSDAGYSDYQQFKQVVNKSYIDISNEVITTTLSSTGKIGYSNNDERNGKGLIYKNAGNVLAEGGIVIGSSSTEIATSIDTDWDFTVVNNLNITENESAIVGTSAYKPIGDLWNGHLSISQISELSKEESLNNVIFYKFNVRNNGDEAIDGLKFSLFADWDLIYKYNQAKYHDDLKLFYTYSEFDEVLYAGIQYLGSGVVTPYGFDLVEGGNDGIDITAEYSNILKWFAMNHTRDFAGSNESYMDVATQLTSPVLSIKANDSVEVPFALVLGDNYYELITNAQKARDYYSFTNKQEVVMVNNQFDVYPNPAQSIINIKSEGKLGAIRVCLYNSLGVKVYQGKSLTIDVSMLSSGIYYLNIESDESKVNKKVIISR